jgi:hypothetical protein
MWTKAAGRWKAPAAVVKSVPDQLAAAAGAGAAGAAAAAAGAAETELPLESRESVR